MKSKAQLYQLLNKQVSSLLEEEHDIIANMANMSALLMQNLEDISWCGFYRLVEGELILGPFQGKVACMHIPLGKGVCGACAQTKQIQRVDNVHEFIRHIACDTNTKSEIVLPLLKENTLLGVLDIDSISYARFDEEDACCLNQLVQIFIQSL